jgi:hypothetical protein
MESDTLTSPTEEEVAFVEVSEEKLQRSFERLIEIRKQKSLLDEEEQSLKGDAYDYLIGIAHTTSGRFVANDITADVFVSYRPNREYDTEGLQKIKDLEEQLRIAKKEGIILNQTPFLVVRIIQ